MNSPTAEYLGRICLSFQGVTEDFKPEYDNYFLYKGQLFAVVGIEDQFRICFQCSEEDFKLLNQKGFKTAPQYGERWIMGQSAELLSLKAWESYLFKAYELSKPPIGSTSK